MANTNFSDFPNGATSFGVPIIGSGGGIPATTGKYFFVSSGTGSDASNLGKTPQAPLATIDYAVGLCTASKGDVIVVMPGHTETLTTATALALDVAGIRIVGLGTGTLRPTITLGTANTTTIAVSAASISIQNFIFVANFADIAACFTTTTAKDFTLVDCEFRDTSSILNFVTIVDTNTTTNNTDGLTLLRCYWFGLGATSNTAVIKMDGTNDRLIIKECYFAHAAVTGAGLMPIATGKVVTNAVIENNRFNFVGATSLTVGTLITTDGTTNSGLLHRNIVFDLDATSEILVTASSGFKFGVNYSSAVADKSGYIVPAQDS